MKPLRTLLFWSHLVAGVTAGLVILIMSVTGVILTYEKQIALWADTRGFAVAPPTADAPRLTIDALLARVRQAKPGLAIQTVTLRSDRTAPAAVTTPDGPLYVDPYSGAVLGPGAPGVRAFFRSVTNWHRWLAVTGQSRPTARAITGAANLLFLFIVCSGVYLWFPRTWTWTQFKQVLWFRRGLPGRARDFNWHNVIGFWSAVPLVVVVASGVVISYPWASNLVYRIAGETPPAPARPAGGNAARGEGGPRGERAAPPGENRRARAEGAPTREDATPAPGPAADLDPAWLRAERQAADWRAISLRLPPAADAPLTFTIDRGESGQPHKRGQLTVDRRTGAVVRWEPFSSGTRGRQLRSILRFAHTGEVLGLAGQTVAGLVSAGGAMLVYTGLFLSFRRFISWRRRRAAAAAVSSRDESGDRSIGAAAARRAEALD
jgi:uncharacterized iron-regulated membrane protein